MEKRRPRLELRPTDVTVRANGVDVPCVAVSAHVLGDLQQASSAYMEGFKISLSIDELVDGDRELAALLLAKVVAHDEGQVMETSDIRLLLVHPWHLPPDGGSSGVEVPVRPSSLYD